MPSLHTAIESAATTEASISKRLPRLDTSGQPPIGRPPGSVLTSPIFSQSSSMPDSFEELGQKNYESLNQIAPQRPTVPYQPPDQIAPQRSSASWPVNPTYPDMATSYAQRAPYYPQPMSQLKHEPGLPSIRDMPFASPTIPSPSYNTVYGASSQGPLPMDYGNSFRRSSYTDGRQLSQTYPPYARPYSMDKYDPGYRSQNLPHSVYSQPYTDYQSNYHTSMGHGPYHSMDHHSSSKKRRGNLPKPVTDILRNWLHQNMEHPYPTEEEKNQLIERTGLSMAQVSSYGSFETMTNESPRSATGSSTLDEGIYRP